MDEAKDYHLLPDRRSQLKTLNNKARCGPDPSGLIYAIGGLTKSGVIMNQFVINLKLTDKKYPLFVFIILAKYFDVLNFSNSDV